MIKFFVSIYNLSIKHPPPLPCIFISCSFLVPLHYHALKLFPSLWYNRKIKPLWIRLSSMYFEIKKNLHFQPFLEQNTKCLVYVFICISMDQAIFREIWCMTIPNWADKNFPLSSPENPICHHSQFILPLICTDHHLIVPLLLWRSQPLGPWTHLLSAGLSTHQNQIIHHDQEMKVSAIIRETSPIDSFLHGPVALTHKDDPNHWPCVRVTYSHPSRQLSGTP